MPTKAKRPIPAAPGGYISDIDAAAYLGLAVSTLRNHRFSGTGPRYAKLGSAVRYTYRWLDTFAQAVVVDPQKRSVA